jgi:hypothetical protein
MDLALSNRKRIRFPVVTVRSKLAATPVSSGTSSTGTPNVRSNARSALPTSTGDSRSG